MQNRIVFGIVSALENPVAVAQLVDAIGPDARIVIHHDFTKQPDFRIRRSNVTFVPHPVVTAWGEWSFCEAILLTMSAALDLGSFDYFQLLSGTCLPIKPIQEFDRFVSRDAADVNMDLISLDNDFEAMMSHGFRSFAPDHSLRQRVLRRTSAWYYGDARATVHRAGLGIQTREGADSEQGLPARARLARAVLQLARRGVVFKHPYGEMWQPYIGSTWFGCRPAVCEYLVRRDQDDPMVRFMRHASLADELFFQTLVGNSPFRVEPSNHFINSFDTAHPRWLDTEDKYLLFGSEKFFARKFSNDPTCALRRGMLQQTSTAKRPFAAVRSNRRFVMPLAC